MATRLRKDQPGVGDVHMAGQGSRKKRRPLLLLDVLRKFNPYHDKLGLFTTHGVAGGKAPPIPPVDPKVHGQPEPPAPRGRVLGGHSAYDKNATVQWRSGDGSPEVLHGVPLTPWRDAPKTIKQWQNVEGQNFTFPEPPLERKYTKNGTAKHEAAGVIIQEPDGRVWVVEPRNHYGGYRNTFPKGSREPGLSLQQTAIKETFEESGLKVRITGHATDIERSTSVARYYYAQRIGGSPAHAGEETFSVKLAPTKWLRRMLNQPVDRELANLTVIKKAVLDLLEKGVGNPYRDPATGKYTSGGLGGAKKPMLLAPQLHAGATKPPAPVSAPAPTAETVLGGPEGQHNKIGGQGGTNPGGTYVGADGVKRYVKFYTDDAQAAGEHLANSIYRDLGHEAPESVTFGYKGRTAYAGKIVEGTTELGTLGLTPGRAKGILEGFAADILTANWDAVGLTHDNAKFRPASDAPVRIDNGGAFLMRAKAGRKDSHLLNQITEFEGFANPNINPAYARVFKAAGVTPATVPSLKSQVAKIVALRDQHGGWANYVNARVPASLPASDRGRITEMLEHRTMLLQQRAAQAASGVVKRLAAVVLEKFNPNHHPAGAPGGIGGQFAPAGVNAGHYGGAIPQAPEGVTTHYSTTTSPLGAQLNQKLANLYHVASVASKADLTSAIAAVTAVTGPTHPMTAGKFNKIKDELLAHLHTAKAMQEPPKPPPGAPAPLPGTHGIAKWNNATIDKLKAATSLEEVAAVSISTNHHQSVKDFKSALLAHFGGDAAAQAYVKPAAPTPKAGPPKPPTKLSDGSDIHPDSGLGGYLAYLHAAAKKGDAQLVSQLKVEADLMGYPTAVKYAQKLQDHAEKHKAPTPTGRKAGEDALPPMPTHYASDGAKILPGTQTHKIMQDMQEAVKAGSHYELKMLQHDAEEQGLTTAYQYASKLKAHMEGAPAPAPVKAPTPAPPTHFGAGYAINPGSPLAQVMGQMHTAAATGDHAKLAQLIQQTSSKTLTSGWQPATDYGLKLQAHLASHAAPAPSKLPPAPKYLSDGAEVLTGSPTWTAIQNMQKAAEAGNLKKVQKLIGEAQQLGMTGAAEHGTALANYLAGKGTGAGAAETVKALAAKPALKLPPAPTPDTSGKYPKEAIDAFHAKVAQMQAAAMSKDPVAALDKITAQSKTLGTYKSELMSAVEDYNAKQPARPAQVGTMVSKLRVIADHHEQQGAWVQTGATRTHAEMSPGYHAHRKSLPSEQQYAVNDYQGSGYHHFNKFRDHPDTTPVTAEIKALDKALASKPLDKDTYIIRNLESTYLASVAKSLVGKVIEDPAYMSTSLDGNFGSYKNIRLHLNAPKGTKGMYLAGSNGSHYEAEVLLARNTRYKVTKVQKHPDGKTHIYGHVLPPDQQPSIPNWS